MTGERKSPLAAWLRKKRIEAWQRRRHRYIAKAASANLMVKFCNIEIERLSHDG